MPIDFEPSAPADLENIVALMRSAFQTDDNAPYLNRDLLRWKYYEPGPDWVGSRSYVMRQDGRIVAHGCLWPVRMRAETGEHQAACLIDWASEKGSAGVGMALVRKLETICPILLSLSGSEMTRKIMPRFGFATVGDMPVYARVIRPVRQAMTRPSEPLGRAILRCARNTMWSFSRLSNPGLWRATRAESIPETRAECTHPQPCSIHSRAAMQHMLRCPVAGHSAFLLTSSGNHTGWFILSHMRGQVRIVDLRITSADPAHWRSAYAAAARAAIASSRDAELIAYGSTPVINAALHANGFRMRDRRPVFVRDPKKLLGENIAALHLNMLDDDSSYIDVPDYPYVT